MNAWRWVESHTNGATSLGKPMVETIDMVIESLVVYESWNLDWIDQSTPSDKA